MAQEPPAAALSVAFIALFGSRAIFLADRFHTLADHHLAGIAHQERILDSSLDAAVRTFARGHIDRSEESEIDRAESD